MISWNWNWQYCDPKGFSRVVAPHYNDGLRNSAGAYASVKPPTKGTGPLWFRTDYKLYVNNPNAAIVHVRSLLGVGSVIVGAKPMYPYLGVAHGAEWEDATQFVTIWPSQQVELSGFRLDIVDNDLQSDQPIPGWPNWTMANGQLGVPPFIVVQFFNDSPYPVNVLGLQMQGQAWS